MEDTNFNNNFAPWMRSRVLNPYWSYSYVNNSQYYASIPASYNAFMRRYVQESLFWNDGWNPHFHNADQGIFSTGLGGAIVKRLADKVFGAKLYYRNVAVDDEVDLDKLDEIKPNESVLTIMDWAEDTNFADTVAKAVNFALAAGTSILKINRNHRGRLSVEALRFDQAFPMVNADGTIEELRSVVLANIPFTNSQNKEVSYVVEEHRFYGDYEMLDGTIKEDVPLVEYAIRQFSGDILNGVYATSENVDWASLPKPVKDYIKRSIPDVIINKPIVLPFEDLGVEIVKASSCIPSLPMLPFGESVLHKIIPHLEEFDYAFSAECTDMYLGRGRVIVPKGLASADTQGEANSGLDDFLYEKVDYMNPDDQKPLPVQFDIRSEQWKIKAENILNLIAINLGVSNITLASFLQDNSAAKTAREVSTQENETMAFVQTTRGVMERPINKILNRVRLYMGLEDKVAIRWSTSVMENPYLKAEMLSMAMQGGFISKWKAIQMFNSDNNDVQNAKEYQRVIKDSESQGFGNADYSDDESMDYFTKMGGQTIPRDEWEKQFGEQEDGLVYDNKTTESTGDNN